MEQIRGIFQVKRFEAQERVKEDLARLARVEARLRQIEMEGRMPMYDVTLKKIPAQQVAAVRKVVPNYGALGMLYGELFAAVGQYGLRPLGPTLAIYHDPEFKEKDPDIEAAIPAAGSIPAGGPACMRELPAAEMACVIYKGPYEGIGEGYHAAMAWLEPNGYKIAGPVREVYLHGPGDTQNPTEYVTEIQVPVEKVV